LSHLVAVWLINASSSLHLVVAVPSRYIMSTSMYPITRHIATREQISVRGASHGSVEADATLA
jgi:hypothetical protein